LHPTKSLVYWLVRGESFLRWYQHGPCRPHYKARAPRPEDHQAFGRRRAAVFGRRLQLWITPDGGKRWRLAYRFGGVEKTFAIGVYPEVGLKDARHAREGARKTLAHGQDPSRVKKAAKAAQAEEGANTFATIAGELADKKRRDKKVAATLRMFEWFMSFALPALGS
jgi:Arm DNA-binding domain